MLNTKQKPQVPSTTQTKTSRRCTHLQSMYEAKIQDITISIVTTQTCTKIKMPNTFRKLQYTFQPLPRFQGHQVTPGFQGSLHL